MDKSGTIFVKWSSQAPEGKLNLLPYSEPLKQMGEVRNSPILSKVSYTSRQISKIIILILIPTITPTILISNIIPIPYSNSITPILPKTTTVEHGYLLKNHIPQKQEQNKHKTIKIRTTSKAHENV